MHCPRCGTPNEPGDRYCSSCGAALEQAGESKQRTGGRDRLDRLIGTTRRARIITAATAIALIVAIVAFIALEPEDDSIPRDSYTVAADQLCLDAKRQIVAVEQRLGRTGDVDAFAQELVPIVANWRSRFEALQVPSDRVAQAEGLEGTLLEAEVELGGLARVAASGDRREVVASAEEADDASVGVEEAVAELGLSECASARIGLSENTR